MKGRRVIYLLGAVAAATAALVLPATAGATNNLVCGGTIDTSVTLPANMDCSGTSATALTITKSGVTLNFGGHTITGNTNYDVIDVVAGASNVTIENGIVHSGWDQISTNHDDYLVIQNMTMYNASYIGMALESEAGALVTQNNVTGAASHDIRVRDGGGNAIFSNTVSDVGNYWCNGCSSTMYINDETSDSIEGNTSFLSGNVSAHNTNFKDYYSDKNLWYGNVAYGGYYGFHMYADGEGTVTVTGNGAAGQVGSGSTASGFYIEDMYLEYNNPSNQFSLINGNTASSGVTGANGFYEAYNVGATFTNNMASRNDGNGYYFDYPWGETITGNTAQYNNGDGFYLETYGANGDPLSFANNNAWYNQGWGFESDGATVGKNNTGLSGGTPTNNGGECYSVLGCN
ncbi:MAG: NosD domain-containing protein [Gaiellaceae bacterium]